MQKIIIVAYMLLCSLCVNAGEPMPVELGGGKKMGEARIVGMNSLGVIISCDKNPNKVCLYVLNQVSVFNPSYDFCNVVTSWAVPPSAPAQFNPNYPYAFALRTPTVFYPASDIHFACAAPGADVIVTIETPATITP